MGRQEIIEKLDRELKKDLREECQVVYILSRIRKILEAVKTVSSIGSDRKYQLLWFYCSWVLHYVMDKSSTQKLLKKLFADEIDNKKSAKENARMLKCNNPDFFKLSSLKLELHEFFKEHELSFDLLDNKWSIFCPILLEIIKETPIRFTSGSLQEIKLIRDKNGDYCYKFTLVGKKDKPIVKLKIK